MPRPVHCKSLCPALPCQSVRVSCTHLGSLSAVFSSQASSDVHSFCSAALAISMGRPRTAYTHADAGGDKYE